MFVDDYLFIKPYTGYGDWMSINGMVRFLSEKYKEVHLIGDESDTSFISNLYRDNNKIKISSFGHLHHIHHTQPDRYDYLDLQTSRRQEPGQQSNHYNLFNPIGKKFNLPILEVKNHWFDAQFNANPTEASNFSEECKHILDNNASAFYVSAGIPKNYRVDYFHYERDLDSENIFFNQLNLPEKYVVISEYGENLIEKKFISNQNLPIININGISQKYFDIIKVIENAEEVHLIENSTALLVYHLQYKNLMCKNKINFHTYARKEIVRQCLSRKESNIFIDMMTCPKLENWEFIYLD